MPSTPNVRMAMDEAREAASKRITAYQLNIKASAWEMEASLMELVACQARAQADQALTEYLQAEEAARLTATRASYTAPPTEDDPEQKALQQVCDAAVQARNGARAVVRCFAQAKHADHLGMGNADTEIQKKALQLQEDTAIDMLIRARRMANEAHIPQETRGRADRGESEQARSDILDLTRIVVDTYEKLRGPPLFEDSVHSGSSISTFREGQGSAPNTEGFSRLMRRGDRGSVQHGRDLFSEIEYRDSVQNSGGLFTGRTNFILAEKKLPSDE